jgi:hypothetical protein
VLEITENFLSFQITTASDGSLYVMFSHLCKHYFKAQLYKGFNFHGKALLSFQIAAAGNGGDI